MPRDVDAAASNLHALLGAAQIKTPIILVGHSLGTNIARRERVQITHSSHEIPNDQPDAVVDAVKKMIGL